MGHGVIIHQGQFIVVGGNNGLKGLETGFGTESCILKGDSIQCTTVGPELENYYWYPEMMPVPENFCPK